MAAAACGFASPPPGSNWIHAAMASRGALLAVWQRLRRKMAGFSSMDDKKLVAVVAQHPALYDSNAEGYKDVAVRKNIWESIAQQVNKHEKECKSRWKMLRDSYFRCKNKEKKKPRAKSVKWHLYNQLSFLNVVIGQDCDNIKQETNCENSCEDTEDFGIGFDLPLAVQFSESDVKPLDNGIQSEQAEQERRLLNNTEEVNNIAIEQRQMDIIDNVPSFSSSVDSFGEHVKSVLNCLPTRLMIQAKMEIFDTLTKYELQTANSNSV